MKWAGGEDEDDVDLIRIINLWELPKKDITMEGFQVNCECECDEATFGEERRRFSKNVLLQSWCILCFQYLRDNLS